MSKSEVKPIKRALVICYSAVGSDARVSNQIRWLESAGYVVDVLSRGPEHPDATGRKFHIGHPSRRLQLIFFALMPSRMRFRGVVERYLPRDQLGQYLFDVVIVNDHHLLPWVVEAAAQLSGGPVVLDLHELYSGNGTNLLYKFVYARYDDWLLTFVDSPVFSSRLTVAEGIADIYRDDYGIDRPAVVRNVAPFEEQDPSPVDANRIRLVHHGIAAVERGIDIMLDAVPELDERFELDLMIIGNSDVLDPIRRHPAVLAGRVILRDPVAVTEVAKTLNEYDLELIFFPPRFPNNTYALPNKFFEAVQGRLGVVIGESPEIVPFVREHGLGLVVSGWTGSDLASALNKLSAEDIAKFKNASHRAAIELSARGEGSRFISAIGI